MRLYSDSSFSAVESTIRARGARATPARVRVLSLLHSARGPLSHGDIEGLLSKEALPEMDRVTLYRVLDWLVDVELAHKATNARGVFCFTPATPNLEHTQHVHFRCTGCGSVICLDSPPPPPPELPKGFRLARMELDINGECRGCAKGHPRSRRHSPRLSASR
jgi:Fur family ferric uptake transcriptional regulator